MEELDPYIWSLPAEYQSGWGERLPSETKHETIDWSELFGNPNPVEIEVGFGKGLFLVSSGVARPDTNFFGVEIIRKYQLYAATRIAQRNLPNVKTCCGDAKLLLRDFVVPASVQAIHIFFPDPWWKARHKKRTLFTSEFTNLIIKALSPNGLLHFVTDVEDYYVMVSGILREAPELMELAKPEASEPSHDMDYLTNFERKFRKEGRPIYRSHHQKCGQ